MHFNSTKYYSILFCCLIVSASSFGKKDAKLNGLKVRDNQSLYFMENNGQVVDQNNNARTDIQYKLSANGIDMFLGHGQLHYQFSKTEKKTASVSTYRMDVELLGSNPDAQVVAEEKQDYFERYYLPQFGENGMVASAYKKITYKNVYNNIDWVIYIKNNKVEYDFVVRPGGNVKDIQLKYNNTSGMNINAEGGMTASTPMGKITENKPYAYETQGKKEVASKFVIKNNIVGFETGDYKGTLTIDPFLMWATYYGGIADDEGRAIAADNQGNIYMTGSAVSTTLATNGTAQNTYGGGTSDAYLVKFNAFGARQWATYYGGTGADSGASVACDSIFAVYIAGSTTTLGGMASGSAYQIISGGGDDGFLAKFNPATGARVWATYFGGANEDYVSALTTDHFGNVYIGGFTQSTASIATAGSYQSVFGGTTDGFLAQFNSTGTIQWATYFGGSAVDEIYGITADRNSNVYITGITNSIDNITNGNTYQAALNGANDAFLAKFDRNGNVHWSTYYGGSATDQGNAVVCNKTGEVVFVGNTTSPDGIATALAYQSSYGGGALDAFLAKFDTLGNYKYGTYYGGPDLDYGQAVTVDSFNNMYLTGATYSTTGISATAGYQPALGGTEDAYLAKFTSFGQRLTASYIGGLGVDYGYGIATDTANNIYVGGSTNSTSGIAGGAAFQNAFGGVNDAFLSKLTRDTDVVINQMFTDTLLCRGNTFHVHFTTNYPFKGGNTFTVQLSNATGSFASPIAVGSLVGTTSGIITCTLPLATTLGTGYRIRIVASNPAFTSPDDDFDIHVVNGLPANPTATSNSPVCVGGTLMLNTSAPYVIDTFLWSGPNSFTSSLQSPTRTNVVAADSGYYIAQNIHDGCPSKNDTVHVVIGTVTPDVMESSNFPVCNGDSLMLYGNSSYAGVSYHWSGPAAFTSTMQNPSVNPVTMANQGFYYLTDTLLGCGSAKDSIAVTVNTITPVSVSISVAPNDTVCFGTNTLFTATYTNGGLNPQFQWLRGQDTIVGAIYDYYSAYETYTDSIRVVYTSGMACPDPLHDTSNLIVIHVEPIDTPIVTITSVPSGNLFTQGQHVVFTGHPSLAGSNPTYQWQINGVNVPGATNSYYGTDTLHSYDTVTCIVYSSYACPGIDSAMASEVVVVGALGVNNVAFSGVSLFPNPSTGAVTLKGSINGIGTTTGDVEITNAIGQVVYKDNAAINNGMVNKTITIENAASGLYQLKITAGSETNIMRFTINK
jgi:hypothetical protein